ncbi:MAG TPA: hypothetical protein VF292_03880 [Rhodanobacteraceae bacterium]
MFNVDQQSADPFSVERRAAFESRSFFHFRNLQRDAAGDYVSARTRKAWRQWLVTHSDTLVINAVLEGEQHARRLQPVYASVNLAAITVCVHATFPKDTLEHAHKRVELAQKMAFWAACGTRPQHQPTAHRHGVLVIRTTTPIAQGA